MTADNEAAADGISIRCRHLFAYGASTILVYADTGPGNQVIKDQPPDLNG